jgi:hypothetical protein
MMPPAFTDPLGDRADIRLRREDADTGINRIEPIETMK